MKPKILLSYVHMSGTEKKWVDKALQTEWIVPLGPEVDEFEHRLERYLDAPQVVALSAGTAAIHLALVALGRGGMPVVHICSKRESGALSRRESGVCRQ